MSADDFKNKNSEELKDSELDSVAGGAMHNEDPEAGNHPHEQEGEFDPTKPVDDFGPGGMDDGTR